LNSDAVDFEDHPQLATETRALYRAAADNLPAWALKADKPDRGRLAVYRER
jgi:hypothetical protein